MSSPTKAELAPLVAATYEQVREELGLPINVDMSRSNRCDALTLNLYHSLGNSNMLARRELHQGEGGVYHYVIAHQPQSAEPTERDVISDLNPWQFGPELGHPGFLHGPRNEVMQALQSEGAPEWFVSLRGIGTITRVHTISPTPFM